MKFNDIIADIKKRTKAGELPREVRIAEIDRVTEEYYMKTGKLPDSQQLEKLADLVLYEELTDSSPHKIMNNEYPIISDTQIARRQEGKHVRRRNKDGKLLPNKTEIPIKAAYDMGVDKKDYRKPNRRRLSTDEGLVMDTASSRNEERLQTYNDFTKRQPVVSYHISEMEGR